MWYFSGLFVLEFAVGLLQFCLVFSLTAQRDGRCPLGQLFPLSVPKSSSSSAASVALIADSSPLQYPHKEKISEFYTTDLIIFAFSFSITICFKWRLKSRLH